MASEADLTDAKIIEKIEALHASVRERSEARHARHERPQVTFKIDALDPDLQSVVDAGANHGQELNTLLLLQIIRLLRTKEPPK